MSKERREKIFLNEQERLEHFAFRALKSGLPREDIVAICVDIGDLKWRGFLNWAMPGRDWEAFMNQEAVGIPVVRGVLDSVVMDYVGNQVPEIDDDIRKVPDAPLVRALVLSQGASLFYLTPMPHYRDG